MSRSLAPDCSTRLPRPSLKTTLLRWAFNRMPPLRASGGRLTYLADDFSRVRIALPLKRLTRNYVGTLYGGSIYSAIDGIYMVMLIKLLGPGYVVWDKAASIRYRKPARTGLTTECRIDADELALIRQQLQTMPKLERSYRIQWYDAQGDICAEVDKLLHIRRK